LQPTDRKKVPRYSRGLWDLPPLETGKRNVFLGMGEIMYIEYKLDMLLEDGITQKQLFFAYASGAFGEAIRETDAGRAIGWKITRCETVGGDEITTQDIGIIAISPNWLKLI
jgi:hypothetical protein